MHPFAKVSISYRLQREHECSTHTCPEEKRDILQRGHWLSQLGLHVDVVEVVPRLPIALRVARAASVVASTAGI